MSRTTNPNYIEDLSYTVLKRFALFSFTYLISRFAGKPVQMCSLRNQPKIITTNFQFSA